MAIRLVLSDQVTFIIEHIFVSALYNMFNTFTNYQAAVLGCFIIVRLKDPVEQSIVAWFSLEMQIMFMLL